MATNETDQPASPADRGAARDYEAVPADFGGAQVEFPVSFDLRMIYVLESGGTIVEDLEAIYAWPGVRCALIQGIAKPGAKYGRMGSRLTFTSREQMYATYEAIGRLPYIKAAI